ncbi:MAG TPA: DUF3256 family protein [Dysgonamonadaceae bacterium]|nr:DUF3256 family protein [Dysgonamonadaceae bacterium]
MKHSILLFFSCIIFVSYGQKIDDVFETMPDYFLPAFSDANKTMLLVDTSLSVIPYPLGEIERLEYTDTFLSVKTSDVGTMQIKLLPLVNDTQIIAVIKSVCSNVCDSNIRFFSVDWKEIDKNSLLSEITPGTFFDSKKIDDPEFKWALSNIDIYPLHYQFKKGSDDLEVKFDIAGYLSSENFKKIEPFIEKETVSLSWNRSKFVY